MTGKTLLLVGRNKRNLQLLSDFFEKNQIPSVSCIELSEAEKQIKDNRDIHLVLVDVAGYDKSLLDFLYLLYKNGIPFLVIYPPQSAGKVKPPTGSHGVLTKPLDPKALLSLVKNFLEVE